MRYFKIPSIVSRFFLIIIIPMLIFISITIFIFYHRHWAHVTDNMNESLIDELALIFYEIEEIKPNDQQKTKNKNDSFIFFQKINTIFDIKINIIDKNENNINRQKIKDRTLRELAYDINLSPKIKSLNIQLINIKYIEKQRYVEAIFYLPNIEQYLKIDFPSNRIKSGTTKIFIYWLIGSFLLFLSITWIFIKNQIRSITNLTNAMRSMSLLNKNEKYQENNDLSKEFLPSGPKEIKLAGYAFIRMRNTIYSNIKEKIEFLTHIAHDIRTPLTRIKLQTALLENIRNSGKLKDLDQDTNDSYNKAIVSLTNNINEMDYLIKEYLEFIKDESRENIQEIDLKEKLKKIVLKTNDKRIKFISKKEPVLIKLKPMLFERGITNVLLNSVKFAKNKINIMLIKKSEKTLIIIEDDGPGIKKELRNNALNPFAKDLHNKFTTKQNTQNTKGFGLGLAITKKSVEDNNGEIFIKKSKKLGGLKVEICFSDS